MILLTTSETSEIITMPWVGVRWSDILASIWPPTITPEKRNIIMDTTFRKLGIAAP